MIFCLTCVSSVYLIYTLCVPCDSYLSPLCCLYFICCHNAVFMLLCCRFSFGKKMCNPNETFTSYIKEKERKSFAIRKEKKKQIHTSNTPKFTQKTCLLNAIHFKAFGVEIFQLINVTGVFS